jgi:hypothetical protein
LLSIFLLEIMLLTFWSSVDKTSSLTSTETFQEQLSVLDSQDDDSCVCIMPSGELEVFEREQLIPAGAFVVEKKAYITNPTKEIKNIYNKNYHNIVHKIVHSDGSWQAIEI